ncbi:hypothetical protein [Oceanobacter kriegii]|uniref:hypothetical protein n=1 Tax=Oceanobacter kriegii TaxID=64972 RepID=UPI0004222892|nr:hypothetical protein [Oceanobacter kriegii]
MANSRNQHGSERAADEQRIRQWLEQDIDAMPDELSQQLAARRMQAFREAASPLQSSRFGVLRQLGLNGWQAGASMAALATVALAVWLVAGPVPSSDSARTAELALGSEPLTTTTDEFTELDMAMALAELDESEWGMLQDLEFAYWLSELPDASNPAPDGAG